MFKRCLALSAALVVSTSAVAASAPRAPSPVEANEHLAGHPYRVLVPLVFVGLIAAIVLAVVHNENDSETPASP